MLYICIYVAPWSCEARHLVPLYVHTCSGMTIKLNLNLNAAPSALAENREFPSDAWHQRTPANQGEPGLCDNPGPLEMSSVDEQGVPLVMVCRRKVVWGDASNTGWGALCEGWPAFCLWSKEEGRLHINCLEMLAVCGYLHAFLPDLKGHHVLVRSDSMNHQGGLSSRRLFTLVERLLEWAQHNLRSLRATHVPGKLNQRIDMLSRSNISSEEWTPSASASGDMRDLWQGRCQPFRPQKTTLTAWHILRRTWMRWPTIGPTSSFMHFPNRSDPSGHQTNQGTQTQSYFSGPALDEPALVLKAVSGAHCSPRAHSLETGPPLSDEQNEVASQVRAVGSAPFGILMGAPRRHREISKHNHSG